MTVKKHACDALLQRSMLGAISQWILNTEELIAKALDRAFSEAQVTEYHSLKVEEIGSALKGYLHDQLLVPKESVTEHTEKSADDLVTSSFPELQKLRSYKYYPDNIFQRADHTKNIFHEGAKDAHTDLPWRRAWKTTTANAQDGAEHV